MVDVDTLRDRFEGCLLGGAAGDALGYGIEFWYEPQIFSRFGSEGISTLQQARDIGYSDKARFSDDTQMTLFTANGLTYGMERTGGAPEASDIFLAYCEWLGTQGDTSRMEDPASPEMWLYGVKELHALRAPGNTCLSATRHSKNGGTLEEPVNDSCGCGGVMRVAPIGLLAAVRDDVDALQLGAEAGALTHGHPLGWLPAALLADIVRIACATDTELVEANPRDALYLIVDNATKTMAERFSAWPEAHELQGLVVEAMRLSEECDLSRAGEVRHIHKLGEGWVGDQAIAIAIYAALTHADDFAKALSCAVNHNGDSDSTGAIAGNILGALRGREALERELDLSVLEGYDLLIDVSESMLKGVESAAQAAQDDEAPSDAPNFFEGLVEHLPDEASDDPSVDTTPSFPNPPQADGHKALHRPPIDEGMPYTPLTKTALDLSFALHEHQRDKAGHPYVYHPFHLADQMRSEEAACVALLHDAGEDGGVTSDELRDLGFGEAIVEAVAALTHDPAVPYMDYVLSLRTNPLAREVKLADLRHNANLSRLDDVTDADRRRCVKYLIAQALLDDSADRFDAAAEPPCWHKRIPLDDGRLYFLSVFYDEQGTWLRCSLDVEAADDEHHMFDAVHAETLRRALDPELSLPEALADALARSGNAYVLRVLEESGIPFKSFYY